MNYITTENGNTKSELENYMSYVATYLVDQYKVHILEDMKGPVDHYKINGQNIELQAKSMTAEINLTEYKNSLFTPGKIMAEKIASMGVTHVAFYEIYQVPSTMGIATVVRFGAHRDKEA